MFCFFWVVLWSDHRKRVITGVESLPFGVHGHAGHSPRRPHSMRPFFLRVLGWTSASISTCSCCEETWTRPGRCGGQCSRWFTWELTQPPPCYNLWTCLRSEECPVARHHVSDAKQGGEASSSPLSVCGPAEPYSLKTEGPSRRLGIRKGWTWSLSRCMALGASWKTSSQQTLQHSLTNWQLGWTGFRRATSLPSGGCGNGALESGTMGLLHARGAECQE